MWSVNQSQKPRSRLGLFRHSGHIVLCLFFWITFSIHNAKLDWVKEKEVYRIAYLQDEKIILYFVNKRRKSFCMSDCLNKVSLNPKLKRRAKICAVSWTIIYSLLFPLLAYFALFSAMIFDKPDLSILKGLSIIFILSLIPLSLPISIDLMWSSYVSEEYNKTLIFWSLPWLTLISVLVLDFILSSWI